MRVLQLIPKPITNDVRGLADAKKSGRSKHGFAALAILVVVAIIAILYMVDLTAIFGLDGIDPYADRPWFQDDRLLKSEEFPVTQKGSGGKTVIKDNLVLEGQVSRKEVSRGKIKLEIASIGAVSGQWNCSYEYDDRSYAIEAEFSGNIDPKKTYVSADGKNKKLLYFITKGQYKQLKTSKSDGTVSQISQTIYVTGWIDNDHSAFGKVFVMTDEKEHSQYQWTTGGK
ncbi:MAG: hypothetical protein K8R02_03925 [Anaerohalosphaeraceae bacterium]|nr:hypothetical protein [Anaerohalosphaeraceae bacterium]